MSVEQTLTVEQIKELSGRPRLMWGEREEDYWKLWSAHVQACNPQSLFDWFQISDYAMKSWEQRRLRKCNSALIDSVLVKAVQNLLSRVETGRSFGFNQLECEQLSEAYCFGNEKDKRRAVDQIERLGITVEMITAEAMRLRAQSLVMFDKLDSHRANAKRALLDELDRRSESRKRPN